MKKFFLIGVLVFMACEPVGDNMECSDMNEDECNLDPDCQPSIGYEVNLGDDCFEDIDYHGCSTIDSPTCIEDNSRAYAYNPETKVCFMFPNHCIPDGWIPAIEGSYDCEITRPEAPCNP